MRVVAWWRCYWKCSAISFQYHTTGEFHLNITEPIIFYRRSTLMKLWMNKLSLSWRKKQKSNSRKWQKCSKESLRMGNVVKLLEQISGAIIRNKNKLNMMKAWCLMANNVKEWFSIIKICWITKFYFGIYRFLRKIWNWQLNLENCGA